MAQYASSDLVQFGMITEAVEGTLEVSAPVPVILTTGITPDFVTSNLQDDTISGAGEVIDNRTTLRGMNLTTPAMLRFNDCRDLIAPPLRDVYVAAVTIVGSADINVVLAGTHNDGSTGTQITVADTTSFDTLIEYGGVTAVTHPNGGAEGLLMRVTGFTDSENNWHRRIKAVWKDGGASYIDISDGYVSGTAGFFAEPMVADTLESPTIAVGLAVRNRVTGAGVISKTGLWQYTDMTTFAKYGAGHGFVANDFNNAWSGKDGATIETTWIGYGQNVLDATDPTGQGFVDNTLCTGMMIGAEDLQFFAIITATNPIVLSTLSLNAFNFSLTGNCAAIDDVSGTSTVTGVRRGTHMPSGSIDYYLVDDVRSEELAQLGDQATSEKGEISYLFKDEADQEMAFGVLWNEFGQTGPVPGSIGNTVGGTIEFNGQRLTKYSRSFVAQEIPAA